MGPVHYQGYRTGYKVDSGTFGLCDLDTYSSQQGLDFSPPYVGRGRPAENLL
jgi:hypothetical protein